MTHSPRLPALDLLRAVAILLVLGRHALFLANWKMDLLPLQWRGVLGLWHRGGWIGVDLFFVLSGFLITGLLFRDFQTHGSLSVGRFLTRRALKIYPAYYLMLGLSAVVVAFSYPGPFPWMPFVRETVFVQNYLPAVWDHTWSLAIEEHFYLLMPLLLLALRRVRPNNPDPFRPIVAVYVVVMLTTLTWRTILAWQLPTPAHYLNATFLTPTHLRIDSLFLGSVLAYFHHFRRDWLDRQLQGRSAILLVIGVLLLLPAFLWKLDTHALMYTVGFTVIALGSGCLILGLLALDVPTNLAIRSLALIGRHSYSIYLWHLAVAAWGIAWLQWLTGKLAMDAKIAIYFVLSLAVGIGLGYAVERPFLGLRDRYFPSRSVAPQ